MSRQPIWKTISTCQSCETRKGLSFCATELASFRFEKIPQSLWIMTAKTIYSRESKRRTGVFSMPPLHQYY